MKHFVILVVAALCVSSAVACTALAQKPANECMDSRVVKFEGCGINGERVLIQGQCAESYEFESTFCSLIHGAPNCLDIRTSLFTPCETGKTWVHYQGKCKNSFEAEHSYCAVR